MTLYDVLGVSPAATSAEIRHAFVGAAREHHPDTGGDATRMRELNEAWAVLGDADRRAAYDRTLAPAPVRSPPPAEPVVRTDEEELLADLEDDRPIGGIVKLPGWLSLVPPAVFLLSVLLGFGGLFFMNRGLLAAGFAAFLASCVLFLVSPFVALLLSRTGSSATDDPH